MGFIVNILGFQTHKYLRCLVHHYCVALVKALFLFNLTYTHLPPCQCLTRVNDGQGQWCCAEICLTMASAWTPAGTHCGSSQFSEWKGTNHDDQRLAHSGKCRDAWAHRSPSLAKCPFPWTWIKPYPFSSQCRMNGLRNRGRYTFCR